ncbi:MAG: Aquaporin Z [uncultured Rubrobacteraceae bacterium]|uniref:Aquaporin Z n=1 Tax=uncultured Rubrobacteraceae bacterium TaxID=349277 RepID=A0A6J4QU31_9ACTN|nr:MAG: Aquaporin Z [uncultured Rubrobacteraceae bacterium]
MDEPHPGQADSSLRTGRGNTRIDEKVVSKIAGITAGEVEGVLVGGNVVRTAGGLFQGVTGSRGRTQGVSAEVGETEATIDFTVGIEYGKNIPRTVERVRDEVADRIESLTGLHVAEINVTVNDIVSTESQEKTSREVTHSGPTDKPGPEAPRDTSGLRNTSEARETASTNKGVTDMDEERYRREEEARRSAEERQQGDPRVNEGGRGEYNRLEEERQGGREARVRRVRGSSNVSEQETGQSRQDDEGSEQPSGLYGSSVDSSNMVGAAVAELIGTFILIFTGCAVAVGAILQRPTAGPIYDSLAVALAFGIALVVIVAAIGHVSGAHVNPAVTLSLAATNKFSWQYVPIYIGAQLLGAVLGAIAVWIAFGEGAREVAAVAATFPTDNVGDLRALLVEILVTFILVFVIVSVATDDRAPAGIAPLAVGFALACGVLIAGPITGGSLNPARTLGPMIIAGQFTAVWVYIVGPIIGGVLAALVYDRFASQANATE